MSITDIYWRVSIDVRGIDANDTTGCLEFWIFDIPQSIIRIHYEVSILANVGKLHYSNSHKYPFVWLLNNTMQRGNLMFFKYSFKPKSIENHPTKYFVLWDNKYEWNEIQNRLLKLFIKNDKLIHRIGFITRFCLLYWKIAFNGMFRVCRDTPRGTTAIIGVVKYNRHINNINIIR